MRAHHKDVNNIRMVRRGVQGDALKQWNDLFRSLAAACCRGDVYDVSQRRLQRNQKDGCLEASASKPS